MQGSVSLTRGRAGFEPRRGGPARSVGASGLRGAGGASLTACRPVSAPLPTGRPAPPLRPLRPPPASPQHPEVYGTGDSPPVPGQHPQWQAACLLRGLTEAPRYPLPAQRPPAGSWRGERTHVHFPAGWANRSYFHPANVRCAPITPSGPLFPPCPWSCLVAEFPGKLEGRLLLAQLGTTPKGRV